MAQIPIKKNADQNNPMNVNVSFIIDKLKNQVSDLQMDNIMKEGQIANYQKEVLDLQKKLKSKTNNDKK